MSRNNRSRRARSMLVVMDLLLASFTFSTCASAQTTLVVTSGWLVLRGELLPAPLRLEVAGSELKVNGRLLAARLRRGSIPATDEDKDSAERQRLFERFWPQWQQLVLQESLQQARLDALSFWRNSTHVVSAEFNPASDADLIVYFAGRESPEHIALEPPAANPPISEQESSRELADQLVGILSQQALIVMDDDGRWYASAAGEGAPLLEKLRQAAALPPGEERFQAMRTLVPDDELAKTLADRFHN